MDQTLCSANRANTNTRKQGTRCSCEGTEPREQRFICIHSRRVSAISSLIRRKQWNTQQCGAYTAHAPRRLKRHEPLRSTNGGWRRVGVKTGVQTRNVTHNGTNIAHTCTQTVFKSCELEETKLGQRCTGRLVSKEVSQCVCALNGVEPVKHTWPGGQGKRTRSECIH